MACQLGGVVHAVTQRRNANRHHIQPVIQVFAKLPGGDQLPQIHMRGGDNPHVDPRFLFVNLGYNLRPMEIQAAFGLEQLKRLDDMNRHRRENVLRILSANEVPAR